MPKGRVKISPRSAAVYKAWDTKRDKQKRLLAESDGIPVKKKASKAPKAETNATRRFFEKQRQNANSYHLRALTAWETRRRKAEQLAAEIMAISPA